MTQVKWKPPGQSAPLHVVQMIPVDERGEFLVMHRSDKVRSAPSVWSFPSGLHDIGEDVATACRRELFEEYGLEMIDHELIGVYENIAGDDPAKEQYHWVHAVHAALVPDVRTAVNKEPDKHDEMQHLPFQRLLVQEFYQEYPFHPSFDAWARTRKTRAMMLRAIMDLYRRTIH
jgi:ADP-ribose pyrophosphatase YjhB (NUDIX family)